MRSLPYCVARQAFSSGYNCDISSLAARSLPAPTVRAVRHARAEPLLLRGPLQEPDRGHRLQDRRRRGAALAQGPQGEGGESISTKVTLKIGGCTSGLKSEAWQNGQIYM